MGSKSAATLKEIESLRSGLDAKLDELERRMPPVAKIGKAAAAIALGGGASGTAFWFVARRLRSKKKTDETPTRVAVTVFPPSVVPAAIGIAAVWAGVRLFEAKLRSESREAVPSAVVRAMDAGRRGSGA